LEFHSIADPATLRRLLGDPTFIASNIPQVVAVEKTSETTATWTVLIKLGPISRKSLFQGELLESTESTVRFRATGPEATIEGSVSFVAGSVAGTDVTLELSMKGSGPLKAVIDAYLARRVREDAAQFAKALETKLGSPTGPSA
jgi:carbon monoxide dehydrogenase subunit G